MVTIRPGLTLEEFLKLPEVKPALEYEEGVVTQKVSPKGEHSALQVECCELFNRAGRPGKVARAFSEVRVTSWGRSRVPDVAVYRWHRIPRTPAGRIATDFRDPPDIAVEIMSPGQTLGGQIKRCRWYVDHGVPLALLVNDRDESVRLFRPDAEPLVLRGDDAIDLGEILPDLHGTVAELFSALNAD